MKQQFFDRTPAYPTTSEELRDKLLMGNVNEALCYFQIYFRTNNTNHQNHPLLGDLLKFADELEANWNHAKYGEHLAASFIRYKINPPMEINNFHGLR